MHCVIVFIFCSVLLRATDTIVSTQDPISVSVSTILKANPGAMDDRHKADIYRRLVAEKLKKAQQLNEVAHQKILRLYEVERKEKYLVKLRIANNEDKAEALKLQNDLLLTVLWTVVVIVSVSVIVFYRRRIEREKSSLRLYRATFTAREQEKLRFSRELHDDFQSTLSIIHMIAVYEYDHSPQNKRLEELKNSSKNVIQEVRKLSNELYPREINTEGCVESLHALIQRTNKENKSLTFIIKANDFECDKDLQIVLYRSVEELVKNTLSSSYAKEVEMSLKILNGGIELNYVERGISRAHQKRDFKVLRDRIQGFGGKFIEKNVSEGKCEIRVLFSE